MMMLMNGILLDIIIGLFLICGGVSAIDNGIGLTPPMGWRAWKAFYANINQSRMEMMMDALVEKIDGVSLASLGYIYVGLDDHWQNCTRICPNGTVIPSWKMHNDFDYQGCDNKWHNGTNNTGSVALPWYDDDGTPIVDLHRFPDMKSMVDKAHRMGLRAGWYFGNYQCRDAVGGKKWNMTKLAEGSVRAIVEYGFDSVKLDSGFPVASNLTLWADLLNASGRPVMIENCHQGGDAPGIASDARNDHACTGLTSPVSDCPFNFWRTTGDPEPGWGTIMRELNSLRDVSNKNFPPAKRPGSPNYMSNPPRSRPGGFAYPGTLEVGDGSMTFDENAVHFGAWCITSSPLILAFDLTDKKRRDLVWPIITNTEALYVSQTWAGHPGEQVLSSLGSNGAIEVWTKPLGSNQTALFLINTADKMPPRGNGSAFTEFSLNAARIAVEGPLAVRDVWSKTWLKGKFNSNSVLHLQLDHHASQFLIVVPAQAKNTAWPPRYRVAPWMTHDP